MLSKLQTLKEEREQGFTLIELLVVILIIGILSAIAIPAFMNQRKSAVDSSVQSDVSNTAKQIETALVKAGAEIVDVQGDSDSSITVGAVTVETQLSEGTKVTVSGNSDTGYTIVGTNDGGDVANNGGFTYDSAEGGLSGN